MTRNLGKTNKDKLGKIDRQVIEKIEETEEEKERKSTYKTPSFGVTPEDAGPKIQKTRIASKSPMPLKKVNTDKIQVNRIEVDEEAEARKI